MSRYCTLRKLSPLVNQYKYMQLTPLSPDDLFLQMLASAVEYLCHKLLSFCPLKV